MDDKLTTKTAKFTSLENLYVYSTLHKAPAISWNKAKIYFQGYLSAHGNSENFHTTKIPMLTIFYFYLDDERNHPKYTVCKYMFTAQA